ncbi:MAG TPA: YibE/F family protein [Desulfomonilaceae bacterium]|nr:YibE/F family protein [Desulfomonilaceae bacterium]
MFARIQILNRDTVFVLLILLVTCALLLMPNLYNSPYAREEERCAGQVLAVDDSLVKQFGIVKAGSQKLQVRLLDGPYAGREVVASNVLIGKMESDKMFRSGDKVFLVLTTLGNNITAATAYDHYRLKIEALLIALFAAVLIGFTGWSGAKALLAFLFTVVTVWKVLLPGVLMGYDPIWTALLAVIVIAGVTLFSIAGVGRTALVAWLGALLGVFLTAALASFLFPPFRLHGAILAYSETLLYSGFENLNLERLFIAAVFLGASGAVIDLSIDVSAAMNEVSRKRPDLSIKELMKSGLYVGRPMATTMVTTLFMAYMSEYMALLMVLLSKGIPPLQVANLNFISAEVLKTVVGSFGLITVAPFTALVGGYLYGKRRSGHEESLERTAKFPDGHTIQRSKSLLEAPPSSRESSHQP